MAMLSKTISKIFLLLAFLMLGGKHLHRILGLVGFGIHFSAEDIQNAISSRGPEAMYKEISMIIIGRGGWCRGSRSSRSQRSHRSALGTRMDKGFIMNSTGSEGTDCQVCQLLIMQFIMAGKDKTTKRAGKAMVHSEWMATAIAVRRKIGDIGHTGGR